MGPGVVRPRRAIDAPPRPAGRHSMRMQHIDLSGVRPLSLPALIALCIWSVVWLTAVALAFVSGI